LFDLEYLPPKVISLVISFSSTKVSESSTSNTLPPPPLPQSTPELKELIV